MTRILIVEDHPSAARMLDTVLSVEGYVPTICQTVGDALDEMQSHGYDVILLDIGLPGLDGWALLRTVRNLESPPPVIVVSGQLDQGDDIKAISMGAVAALMKPYDPEDLCRLIDAALAARR